MGAYASVEDVRGQNPARSITASTRPNASQAWLFLEDTAAEIDGLLRARGYSAPVATTATSAYALMRQGNVLGAAAMLEQAAPQSDRLKEALHLWEEFKAMLDREDFLLDAAADSSLAVRYPAVSGANATSYFGRAHPVF